MGERSIKHLLKPIIIPSFDLNQYEPLFFKSRYHWEDEDGYDPDLVDVALSAITAPTYFKPHVFNLNGRDVKCVDGGIFMNNPSLAPIFELAKHYQNYGADSYYDFDISLLSIGTGKASMDGKFKKAHKWGLVRWIRPVINISERANGITSDYGVSELLQPGKYKRVEFELDRQVDMANSSDETIAYLYRVADEYTRSPEFGRLLKFIDENLKS
jgi:patatin-like phospholipase/acyl hydrolase